MNALPHPQPAVYPAPPHRAHPERGVVLLVALVMLLLVTVLGLASVRMLTLEERMAANSFDRNLAFQAAETALREGEALAATGPNVGFLGVAMACNNLNNGACADGLCSPPHPDCKAARWENASFAGWRNASTAASPLATGTPQFFVEHLGSAFPCDPQHPTLQSSNCVRYRITARSHDPAAPAAQGRANVVLQSIYTGLGSWAAAKPPTQFIPETFAPTEAEQHTGEDLSRFDSSQNGADTENHKIDDSGYAGAESAEGGSAINVNVVRGRISWREIIPR